eukprot:CAMPEP_0206141142 /NCGR_PEP_ID=MMETSP1473-20131121/11913_1 /ASSEMBLY_ACC=CAM_ASM_001109 /TAXON_ID=1461547 /ORGANISM="Stichococcus sp, Strain RCC1054" /LENGTH=528 /DNA_ID=CAMNT_0053535571 /DNA_START=129 /DNA_END=1715 /DNA_ORIENTATION=+
MSRSDETSDPLLPPASALHAAEHRTLLSDMRLTGMWRVLPMMFIYVVGIAMIGPKVPGIMTDFMASRRAGFPVQCEDYTPRTQPPSCRDAYSDVVWWSTSTSFVTNSILTFLMAPLVGKWSDLAGRRPFMIAAMALGHGPAVVLLAHLTLGTSLLFYYPANMLGGAISIISISLAWIADLMPPVHRAAGFGALMAAFSVGVIFGPAIGNVLDATQTAAAACVCGVCCVLYVCFFIPESLTDAARDKAKERQSSGNPKVGGTLMGLRILARSALFKRLTVCLMVSGIVTDGLLDLLIQDFKLVLNLSASDVAGVFIVFGVCGLAVQTVILRYMLKWVGEKRVLVVGLCAACLEMVVVAFLTAKWQVFCAVTLGSLGGMAFPAISSIKANNVDESEQGTIQGALYGAKALATGAGPIMFAAIFAAFTKSDSPLPYFPGAPFLLGAIILVVAVAVAATIDPACGRGSAALAPLLHSDDEADVEASACSQHYSDLPAPNTSIRADVVNEDISGLLVHGHHNRTQPVSAASHE